MHHFLARDVWSTELGGVPTFRRWFYKLARVLFLTAKGVDENKLLMRAGSLTFITVLSIVPLLAFAFSVAKGLGAYETLQADVIQPFLDETLGAGQQVTEGGDQVRATIGDLLRIVDKTDVSRLGGFGLAILLYTVLKLLSSIERTFNDIWGVRRARTWVRRISDYLSICIVVPVLLVTATAVSAAVRSQVVVGVLRERLGLGALVEVYARFSSLVAVWVGFTFVYLFMPNTRVRVRSALLGGLIGGSLWQLAQMLHMRFQVGVANYNAIYSTFAALPIFLFWLYTSWCTVLLGAEVGFAHQNEPVYHQLRRAREHDRCFVEALAVRAAVRVVLRFVTGARPVGVGELAEELQVPEASLEEVVEPLTRSGILVRAEEQEDDQALVPGRDPERVRLQAVIDAVAGRRGSPYVAGESPVDQAVSAALERMDEERGASVNNISLRRLAEDAREESPPGGDC
jgi:membrane protein